MLKNAIFQNILNDCIKRNNFPIYFGAYKEAGHLHHTLRDSIGSSVKGETME